ncbi:MAG: ABC transporter permease [Acidobacteria bacterium]|nr:ABC transporter permease [Acidobacteriota bacterium]
MRTGKRVQNSRLGPHSGPITVDGAGPTGVAKVMAVSPDDFAHVGTPIIRGRGIERRDSASPLPVCVVNQALASHYSGNGDPVGRHIIQGNRRYEIVGVAADAHDTMSFPASFGDNLRSGASPTYYPAVGQPVGQYPLALAYQLLTDGDPAAVLPAVQTAIQSFNQRLTVANAWALHDQIRRLTRSERVVAQLASVVGGVALVLACIGLSGLLSHVVARRTNEIGIRIALGAQRHAIASMIPHQVRRSS